MWRSVEIGFRHGTEKPSMDVCRPGNANVNAFLKLIRFAEHYPDTSDDFYNTLYGGGRFLSYAVHPNRAVRRWGHTSTAAGAYQILYSTWAEARKRGVVNDFSPQSQDALAFYKLSSRGAAGSVCEGNLALAFALLRDEWTSLPGGRQSRMSYDSGKAAFISYGGVMQ
jgi:muramidase (phage lysozyme)